MKIKNIIYIAPLLLSACSIQVSGIQNAYQTPSDNAPTASLATSSNTRIISIDGKSTESSQLKLLPGQHQITVYAGKNNYQSAQNVMYVLSANFQPNQRYTVKSSASTAWIETHGNRVSTIVSRMQVDKSIRL